MNATNSSPSTPPITSRCIQRFRRQRDAAVAIGCAAMLAAVMSMSAVTVGAGAEAGESSYMPMTPCRLFDTRPAPSTVGPRSTPLGPGEIHTVQVTGANGDCVIPATATAVSINATAVGASAPSYVTLFPADAPVPLASSLNVAPGQPPTPNSLTVTLSPSGGIAIFNAVGQVDLVGDVTGYFTDEGLAEIGAALDGKADADSVYSRAEIDALLAETANAADVYSRDEIDAANLSLRAVVHDALDLKADAADVYTKDETDAQHSLVYTKNEVAALLATDHVWTANVDSAGAKTSAGLYTSTRLGVGWYRISFNVTEFGFAPGVDRVILATSDCIALVGNSGDSELVVAGTIGLVVVDISVRNGVGAPLDCDIDVMMMIVE